MHEPAGVVVWQSADAPLLFPFDFTNHALHAAE